MKCEKKILKYAQFTADYTETAECRAVHLKIQISIEKKCPSTISHVCLHTNWKIVFEIGKRRDENIFVRFIKSKRS